MNAFDTAARDDFDLMTKELGRKVKVSTRVYEVNYEGQEADDTDDSTSREEYVMLQELDSEHQVVQSGQLDVGDVRITFRHDSIAKEEGTVIANGKTYTIRKLTRVRGMNNDVILYIKAFGKKIPER